MVRSEEDAEGGDFRVASHDLTLLLIEWPGSGIPLPGFFFWNFLLTAHYIISEAI